MIVFKIGGHPFVLVLYMFVVAIIFNILAKYTNLEIATKCFETQKMNMFNIKEIYQKITAQTGVSMKVVIYNLHYILSLIVTNLLVFTVAMLAYKRTFKLKMNIDKEFFAFGVANLFCLVCPGSINYACSGLFILSGNTKRISSLVYGLVLIALFFTFHFVLNYIPSYIALFLMQFMGCLYLIEYGKKVLRLSLLDALQVVGYAIINYFNGGILIVCCLSILSVFITKFLVKKECIIKERVHSIEDTQFSDKNTVDVVEIPKVLDAFNMHDITKCITKHLEIEISSGNIILDFKNCVFVDMSANIEMERYLKENSVKYVVRGVSRNLYMF